MIIVTGLRSGTSLIMQTLKILGVPVAGYAYHDEFMHKDLNPRGYWNLPMAETLGGINHHNYKGYAVKLGGADLLKTNPTLVSKVIRCQREKGACVQSIMRLMSKAENRKMLNFEPSKQSAEKFYELNEMFAERFRLRPGPPFLDVQFEEMLCNMSKVSKNVAEFLDVPCNERACVNNVIKETVCQ